MASQNNKYSCGATSALGVVVIKHMKVALLSALLLSLVGCQAGESPGAGTTAASSTPSKLGLCAGCHGADGRAILPNYPHLAGQNRLYLEKSLRAYRAGERQSAEMRAAVGHLTDAEIAELASYYSAQ